MGVGKCGDIGISRTASKGGGDPASLLPGPGHGAWRNNQLSLFMIPYQVRLSPVHVSTSSADCGGEMPTFSDYLLPQIVP